MKPKERTEARKEVSVLSKMRHPNIVEYKESFEGLFHYFILNSWIFIYLKGFLILKIFFSMNNSSILSYIILKSHE